ncbi:MAG: 2-dehydro-3-deoxygalactonokinase, partial [Pseudomonadota bacterium]
MSCAELIAADWGTTSLRVYVVDNDGAILEANESSNGILSIPNNQFEEALQHTLAALSTNVAGLPVILSGMIGSRQGWVEAPYAKCPASIDDLAKAVTKVDVSAGMDVHIIPGIETRSSTGVPDVIRGEETQIFGALTKLGITDATFLLPGTHSKWVTVENEQISDFQTFMTGEVFSALRDHTILGRMMAEPAGDESFERGVRASGSDIGHSGPGYLLHQLFSTRTLGLFGELSDNEASGYLSGLLIGSELRTGSKRQQSALYVMAGSTLSDLYVRAAGALDLEVITV